MWIRFWSRNTASGDKQQQPVEASPSYLSDWVAEGDLLFLTAFDAKNGAVSLKEATGEVLFAPTPGYTGPASFNYTLADANGVSATGTFGLSVAPVGDTPLGSDATYVTPVDTPISIPSMALFANPVSLAVADAAPTALALDTLQPSALAVKEVEKPARVTNEKLVGSPREDRIQGAAGKSEIDGREGNDQLTGGGSSDILIGGSGDDVLDGGTAGNDIARYSRSVLEYDIERISSSQARVKNTRAPSNRSDGNDLVRNIERLDFKDRQVFLDGQNNAPIAQPDKGFSVFDGASLSIPFSRLLGNDVDFDGDRLSITQVKGKPGKSVRIVGNSVVYTPPVGIQWALAGFSSYESTFLYTVSDGKGGTATASATVTVNRPKSLRGLRTGPADLSRDGAGGPGDPPGATFTKVSGQSITGTIADDLILVPSSTAMTGGTVNGDFGVD
jgi:hypothetical protein